MLTDQQAHDLLHLAADTVEVRPGAFPIAARRRTWPIVAAAASVVLVVGGVTVLGRGGNERPDPAPPPPTGTDDGQFRLGPDQMPSLFGYTSDAAVSMLEARGLAVTTTSLDNECGETTGRVVSADPGPGTKVHPGQAVELRVIGGGSRADAFCVLDTFHRDEAWALIDYANGRGERPVTVDNLDLDPVVDRLREWSSEVGRYETRGSGRSHLRWPTPQLTTRSGFAGECAQFADQVKYSDVLSLTVQLPDGLADGVGPLGVICQTVVVAFDATGRILDVGVGQEPPKVGRQVPADVVGNTIEHATDRLESQGLKVEPVGRTDCQPEGFVTAQEPYPSQDVAPGTTILVAYTSGRGPCVDQNLEIETPAKDAAEALIAFARGTGDLPPVADVVDLYVAGELEKHLTGDVAADHEKWQTGCADQLTAHCLLNMLDVFDTDDVVVTPPLLRTDDPCHVVRAALPTDLTNPDALSRSASFGTGEPRTCAENWEAQVWLDEDGRIFAVNLLLGNPTATD